MCQKKVEKHRILNPECQCHLKRVIVTGNGFIFSKLRVPRSGTSGSTQHATHTRKKIKVIHIVKFYLICVEPIRSRDVSPGAWSQLSTPGFFLKKPYYIGLMGYSLYFLYMKKKLSKKGELKNLTICRSVNTI